MLRILPLILLAFTEAAKVPKTCSDQLATYQQCVLSNPSHCFASCTNVGVILNPRLLASMKSPTKACDAMKTMSCAYQGWCCKNREGVETACTSEKQKYWRCIGKEAGCGAINCEAVLSPSETSTSNTPVVEDTDEENEISETGTEAEVSTPNTPVVEDTDEENENGEIGTEAEVSTPNTPVVEDDKKENETSETETETTTNVEESTGAGSISTQVDTEETTTTTAPPPTSTNTVKPNQRPRTCPTKLKAYQQCVLANPSHCYASCTNVDVILNPRLLASMKSPTKACDAMKVMSCAYQSWCCKNRQGVETACVAEKQAYWRCIEADSGCGAIDCKRLNLPRTSTESTPRAEIMIEQTKLRKKTLNLSQLDEECKEEGEAMQECHSTSNCATECGDPHVEEGFNDLVLSSCWMQDCCQQCNTEQTSYRQCVEGKTGYSLDCKTDQDEIEEREQIDFGSDKDSASSYPGRIFLATGFLSLVSALQ